jgi:subtilisin family serine protease
VLRAANCGATVAAVALMCTPIAWSGRLVSVGYRTPGALRGLRVVQRVPALRTAEARVLGRRAEQQLRRRPGIRFVQDVLARAPSDGALSVASVGGDPAEWQWSALHADLVPQWVLQQAASVTIAVVDTGADATIPALAAKHPLTYDVVTGSSLVQDTVGHGTFVASLAAGAPADPTGMSGFGGDAQLMIVQANRHGSGFSDIDEANAIVWAVDHGAKIVNLSLGGSRTSLVERYAIEYALAHRVLLVAAAGNTAADGSPVTYPAALIGRRGLVVGAANADGSRASFSTTGSYVDVLAPGVQVLGALAGGSPAGLFSPVATPGATGSYGLGSGTSYAAPEVAGAAALVWAADPALDPAGVAAAIEASASGQGVWTQDRAYGNVDIATAVAQAAGGAPPQLAPVVGPARITRPKPRAVPPRRAKVARARPTRKPRG